MQSTGNLAMATSPAETEPASHEAKKVSEPTRRGRGRGRRIRGRGRGRGGRSGNDESGKNACDVEDSDEETLTPIECAAFYGHVDVIDVLLAQGEAVGEGALESAIRIAAIRGHKGVIERLLESSRGQSTFVYNNGLALHGAAVGGHLDLVKLLVVAEGAYVDFPDPKVGKSIENFFG